MNAQPLTKDEHEIIRADAEDLFVVLNADHDDDIALADSINAWREEIDDEQVRRVAFFIGLIEQGIYMCLGDQVEV